VSDVAVWRGSHLTSQLAGVLIASSGAWSSLLSIVPARQVQIQQKYKHIDSFYKD